MCKNLELEQWRGMTLSELPCLGFPFLRKIIKTNVVQGIHMFIQDIIIVGGKHEVLSIDHLKVAYMYRSY